MYSTAGCATCPDAETKSDAYAASNPDKVYAVNVHTSDAMTSPQFAYLDGLLNVTVFSSGSFNRLPFNGSSVLHKTTWNKTVINTCLTKTASAGLMINTVKSGSNGTASVTAGFNKSMSGNYKLTVYLVEDDVTGTGSGYNQANYYNNIASSPFYHLGNPIIGYKHGFVLRKVLSASTGDAVPATSINAGGSYSKTYSFNTTGYNASKLYVIAFVNKLGSSPLTQEIMNVQRVKYGSNKAWD
ncbi:MAG: Omp28-related outer membrane protein [Bacteroidota bacterium]